MCNWRQPTNDSRWLLNAGGAKPKLAEIVFSFLREGIQPCLGGLFQQLVSVVLLKKERSLGWNQPWSGGCGLIQELSGDALREGTTVARLGCLQARPSGCHSKIRLYDQDDCRREAELKLLPPKSAQSRLIKLPRIAAGSTVRHGSAPLRVTASPELGRTRPAPTKYLR